MSVSCHTVELSQTIDPASREQWVHLLPAGKFSGRDGRGPYSVANMEALIEKTKQRAGKMPLPVDYEHQIDNAAENGQPAPAAGWIKGLKAAANGVWGLVEWTEKAADFIKSKEYKYLSPVFSFNKETGNISAIFRAGLTNNPNLEMTALASTQNDSDGDDEADDNILDQLRGLLSLGADAKPEDVVQKIKDMVSRCAGLSANRADYVPLGQFEKIVSELQTTKKEISVQTAKNMVSEAICSGLIPPSLKEWGLSLCASNPVAFETFVKKMPPAFAHLSRPIVPGRYSENGSNGATLSDEQLAVCKTLGHKPENFIATMSGNEKRQRGKK
jgi:phage I-like protein